MDLVCVIQTSLFLTQTLTILLSSSDISDSHFDFSLLLRTSCLFSAASISAFPLDDCCAVSAFLQSTLSPMRPYLDPQQMELYFSRWLAYLFPLLSILPNDPITLRTTNEVTSWLKPGWQFWLVDQYITLTSNVFGGNHLIIFQIEINLSTTKEKCLLQ